MNDEQLSAWLDGEGSPADREAVSAWLRTHPEDALKVEAWRADQAALQAWAARSTEPVPARWQRQLQPGWLGPRPGPRWWALAAGLVLASGLGGAWWARGPAAAEAPLASSAWWQRAAVAHAVFVPEQRHPVDVNVREGDAAARRSQEAHLAQWLTRRLTRPVALFDLQDQGFELMGGRLLPDARGPGAQLMYQRADGRRVTVYLRAPDTPAAAAFRYEQADGLGLFYWVDGGTGYALVGDLPRPELLALAQAIHAQGGGGR